MTRLIPFADDATTTSIGGLTVENGTDRLALYGNVDLTRDRQGLAQARALKAIIDQAVHVLEAHPDLPDTIPIADPAKTVPNPFK